MVVEVRRRSLETPAVRRLVVVVAAALAAVLVISLSGVMSATGDSFPAATPRAKCGPGAKPETSIQGRVPQADYQSGRAEQGYRCNTRQVSQQGSTGGFKVQRYRDANGHTCAFYDSTLLFPKDVLFQAAEGQGVIVLDMSDPRQPRRTATLTSPAMLSPHESLLLNNKRGLLAATLGNAYTHVGVLDLYDVRTDCRHPRLLSSTRATSLGRLWRSPDPGRVGDPGAQAQPRGEGPL